MGNIPAVCDSELGVHPLVVYPFQDPLLDTARDGKGGLTGAGLLLKVLTPAAETSFFLRTRCLGHYMHYL